MGLVEAPEGAFDPDCRIIPITMVNRRTCPGLGIVVLAGLMSVNPAQAQKVGECVEITRLGEQESVIVNQRQLTGEELHLYQGTSDKIDAEFGRAGAQVDVQMLTALLSDVEDLPSSVDESSRSCLRIQIESKAERVIVPGGHLMRDLLTSQNPDLAGMGMSVLRNQNTKVWFADRTLRRLLKAKASTDLTDPDLRVDVLYLFGWAGGFPKVRRIALNLAADEGNAVLARGAAQAVCYNMAMNKQFSTLGDLFHSSSGILRQQAALTYLWSDNETLVADLLPDLSEEVVRMIRSKEFPPETRGEAIEASARLTDNDLIVTTLVEMLEPRNWFFGAIGMHAPDHSLVPLIKVLADIHRPDIHDRLRALKERLSELNDHDRQAVERELLPVLY